MNRQLHMLVFALLVATPNFIYADCKPYKINKQAALEAYSGVVVEQVREERFTIPAPGGLSISSVIVPKENKLQGGVFSALDGRLKVIPPKLSSGAVSIHYGSRSLGMSEPPTLTVKFTEEGPRWRAAVLAIDLSGGFPEQERLLAAFEGQQRRLLSDISPEAYELCRVDGPLGTIVEVVVHNQIPASISRNGIYTGTFPKNVQNGTLTLLKDWPHARVQINQSAPTIGIRREVRIGNFIVEYALIATIPKDFSKSKAVDFIRGEMDTFMSAVDVAG